MVYSLPSVLWMESYVALLCEELQRPILCTYYARFKIWMYSNQYTYQNPRLDMTLLTVPLSLTDSSVWPWTLPQSESHIHIDLLVPLLCASALSGPGLSQSCLGVQLVSQGQSCLSQSLDSQGQSCLFQSDRDYHGALCLTVFMNINQSEPLLTCLVLLVWECMQLEENAYISPHACCPFSGWWDRDSLSHFLHSQPSE